MCRAEQLSKLQSGEVYDILVIGGGATGAGVALDAATRGQCKSVAVIAGPSDCYIHQLVTGMEESLGRYYVILYRITSLKILNFGPNGLHMYYSEMELKETHILSNTLSLLLSLCILCLCVTCYSQPYYWLLSISSSISIYKVSSIQFLCVKTLLFPHLCKYILKRFSKLNLALYPECQGSTPWVIHLMGHHNNVSFSGLKTALVERDDFSSGTSSKSTKLIHGGVRYLYKAVLGLDIEQVSVIHICTYPYVCI